MNRLGSGPARLVLAAGSLAIGFFLLLGCQVIGDFEPLQDYPKTALAGDGDAPGITGSGCGAWDAPGVSGGAAPPSLMIAIQNSQGECFWMDETEVTRAQYQDFLETDPPPGDNECEWNVDYSSEGNNPEAAPDPLVGTDREHPQVYVDWCDASAYCEWLGKSLCRDDFSVPTEVSRSDWYLACSNADSTDFSSGNTAVTDTCRNADNGDAACGGSCMTPWTAGTGISCENALQVQDLNGNVGEWTSGCQNSGPSAACLTRGGSFLDQDHELACSVTVRLARDAARNDVGIRCCAYN